MICKNLKTKYDEPFDTYATYNKNIYVNLCKTDKWKHYLNGLS